MAHLASFQSWAKHRLSLLCYTPYPGPYPFVVREYSDDVDQFNFTTLAPGGFGVFSFRLRIADPFVPRFELYPFSKVLLVSGTNVVFLGELTEPHIGLDTSGDYLSLTALGIGNILRDDPHTDAYVNQTGKQIIQAQLALRVSTWKTWANWISADTSAILPDNPATVFSPSYDNRTAEEVLNDVCLLLGDYTWCVWDDPSWGTTNTYVDGAGYPLGRIEVHARDTATTHYLTTIKGQDVVAFDFGPSGDRMYNDVDIGFTGSSGGYDHRQYTDPRIGGDFSQNTAPFRFRKFVRDLTGVQTVTAAQAAAIANAYGAEFKDATNKGTINLRRARNANGDEIPLWEVRADRNIGVPDLAQRGATLPSALTPGVNQFYIQQTTYNEDGSGATLELQCDNYVDRLETTVARLQLAADIQARSGKSVGGMIRTGTALTGICSLGQSNANAGGTSWSYVSFMPTQLYQAPTSISFTTISASNMTGVAASDLRAYGFSFSCNYIAAGGGFARFNFTTNGNCIRAIRGKELDWHCDGCGKEFRGLAISRYVRVVEHALLSEGQKWAPGHVALAIDCPECAATEHPHTESFNTALLPHDEDHTRHGNYHHRAEQARLIRQLMRHGAIGLEVLS